MNLIAPAALALGALAVPLVVLYMLRSRRQRLDVPSTRMWEGEEQFVSAAIPWQRLRITAALLLQLLALAAFALLLARPFALESTLLGPHTVLIIDSSGSMATAGRLDAAKAEATKLVADASEERLVSVIEAGPRARVLAAFSRDPDSLVTAVAAIEPTGGTDDLVGALKLARGLATPDRPSSIVFLTDGGTPGGLPEPINDADHLRFDAPADNVAITALGTSTGGEGDARLFVEVASFSLRSEQVAVQIVVDGLSAGTVDVALEPGQRVQKVVAVDASAGSVVTAALVDHVDGNLLDNSSAAVLGGLSEVTITTVGEGSLFLDALFSAMPGVGFAAGRAPDIVVIDRGDASQVDRPAWIIAPTTPPNGVLVSGRLDEPVITYQRPAEPILEGLDLGDIVIAEAQTVVAEGWLPLLRAGDVPLILLGDVDGQRAVYFAFDLTRSNLPVQVSFPILGARIVDWLGGNRLSTSSTAPAGTPIPLAPPTGTTPVVTLPDGTVRDLDPGTVAFAATSRPGIYRVDYRATDGTVVPGVVAARQFSAAEAAAEPYEIEVVGGTTDADETATLLREWAPLILALLIALVLLEWWVAFGRPLPGGVRGVRGLPV